MSGKLPIVKPFSECLCPPSNPMLQANVSDSCWKSNEIFQSNQASRLNWGLSQKKGLVISHSETIALGIDDFVGVTHI